MKVKSYADISGKMHKRVYKCPNYTANLKNMRLQNKWCDLIIKVGKKEFRAHKNILAANLQYFDTMLSGDSFRESKEGVVTMECMNATDVEAFITYAYTSEISLTDNNALSLLETANYLGEDGIKQACTEFLEKHLKVEESFKAYKYAKSIDCVSLKNTSRSKILLNFENISQSSEYLDLDFESLTDVLSDGKAQPVKLQKIFFEGIMRWILHDAMKRRFRIHDLLSFIDVSKLPADYMVEYIGSKTNSTDNESGFVVKDLISWYYARRNNQLITTCLIEHLEQTLMILGRIDNNICFQVYNFVEKKWSQPKKIPDANLAYFSNLVVLNDKFYFICYESGSYNLHVLDPSANTRTVINSSSSILRGAALCACSRFLYLCGGWRQDGSDSDQVLRYDPQTNSFETLPPMRNRRVYAAAIFYRGCLHVLGGVDGSSTLNKNEKYDPDTKKWIEFPSMCNPHAQHTVAVLDEKLYVCGSYESDIVEVYDPAKNSWQLVVSMNRKRRVFTLVAYEGKLLAIGGHEEKSVEVYDPSKDQWQMDEEMSSGLRMTRNIGGMISFSCTTDAQ